MIPPTVGFEVADPDCPVDVSGDVAADRSDADRRSPSINSFASGGTNFSLVVKA